MGSGGFLWLVPGFAWIEAPLVGNGAVAAHQMRKCVRRFPLSSLVFFFGGGEFLETAIEQTEVVDVVVWPQVSYEESVPKDLEVNRTVMRITAADVDFGENARIAYALQAGQPQDRDYFDVDRTTGIIQLKKPLTVRSLHSFIHPCLPRFSLST